MNQLSANNRLEYTLIPFLEFEFFVKQFCGREPLNVHGELTFQVVDFGWLFGVSKFRFLGLV